MTYTGDLYLQRARHPLEACLARRLECEEGLRLLEEDLVRGRVRVRVRVRARVLEEDLPRYY